jgi:hypothetical protein
VSLPVPLGCDQTIVVANDQPYHKAKVSLNRLHDFDRRKPWDLFPVSAEEPPLPEIHVLRTYDVRRCVIHPKVHWIAILESSCLRPQSID